ncbi:hypothetical protein TNCV_3597481 [Trichonephila clavipes]|nr:hypothetical protein TNCV_3597481 [Trichonephila clavipes]
MEQPVTLLTRLKSIPDTDVREDRIVSRRCRYPWPLGLRFNTDRLRLWGYLKSRVSIRSIKSVGTERCDPQREVSSIHPERVALYRCWICHSPGLSSPPVVVVMWCNKVVKSFRSLCMHCFFDLHQCHYRMIFELFFF